MPIQTETDFDIKQKIEEKNQAEENQKVIKIRRKKQKKASNHNYWFDFAVAASIAGIIFMAFLIPNVHNMKGEKETVIAGSIYTNNNVETKPAKVHKDKNADTTSAKSTIADSSKQDNTIKESAKTEKEPKPEVAKNYTIVLASFVTEKNSNILIQDLTEQGLPEGRFIKNGKTTRVVYSAYATEEEARAALTSLREQNEVFDEAWTMKMN